MKVIIDCNIWISFLLGHQTFLVRKILINPTFDIFVCHELLTEIKDVASREKIRKYIDISDIDDLLNLIHDFCIYAEIQHVAASQIRDAKDLYLLSLSETVGADYIVSGDKYLLVLERHGQTKMIKLMDFKLLCGL
ncbi:putative toxin-antitoxin system toxin component, PIN family [Prevotella koreensis]|uniref:Putative toxin-antitoxin system toxin component, PIN family n=1 Tax=Prevotella koreensis TaxID=2490854 RepID=A0A3S0S051_9BACT|nr:putative toxin-antitoxin system toxin component, PIN family [Prevotella koreensis]RUL59686.1 putative toxin-antitoxin system toxin component, PIN family [Prevotella koreensis]